MQGRGPGDGDKEAGFMVGRGRIGLPESGAQDQIGNSFSAGGAPGFAGGRRRRAVMRPWALVLGLVLAFLALGASSALAAETGEQHATMEFGCKSDTINYTGFPNLPKNTVTEQLKVDGVIVVKKKFVFDGPTASDTIFYNVPPGHHSMDIFAKWNTNGVKGGHDQPLKNGITCEADPGFTIEKLQKIDGTASPFTTSTLPLGHVGQTVDYEIVVKNTGNVPLGFGNFTDPKCDEGTITGGPGEATVPAGGSTTYLCKHLLTEADREVGFYTNSATVTGTPPEGSCSRIASCPSVTKESNTVVVELPTPGVNTEFGCKNFVISLSGFPNVPNNTVKIKIKVDGVAVLETNFTFNGPTGTFVYEANLGPGKHSVDAFVKWNTNTFKGGRDQTIKGGVTCLAEPGFSIEKLQKIEGSSEPFTAEPIEGEVAQTVDYEVIVKNTGNVPLTFGPFTDEGCDEGTIAGGPGEASVAPGGSSTYTCQHTLTLTDQLNGSYSNTATDTGTPPEGQGLPVTQSSNTVVTNVKEVH